MRFATSGFFSWISLPQASEYPITAKLSKSWLQVCLAEFCIWKKFELEHTSHLLWSLHPPLLVSHSSFSWLPVRPSFDNIFAWYEQNRYTVYVFVSRKFFGSFQFAKTVGQQNANTQSQEIIGPQIANPKICKLPHAEGPQMYKFCKSTNLRIFRGLGEDDSWKNLK